MIIYERLVANLNLYAVLPNLEDLVRLDPAMRQHCAAWNISIQFTALGGPKAFVSFKNGECSVGRGEIASPTVRLFFTSPGHLNKMFDGSSQPIPLKGFTKLRFLSKDFTRLTERMEYFLRPTDELLKDPDYLALNTLFTLNTAALAVAELAALDPVSKTIAAGIQDGTALLKVLPDGPAAHVTFYRGRAEARKGDTDAYDAAMFMKDLAVANAFLNQKIDPFMAIGLSDVMIRGQASMLDSMGLILDRIPHYLS